MAIHDTDKKGLDRGAPTPNAHDTADGTRMAHGTLSNNYLSPSADPNELEPLVNGMFKIVDAGSTTIPGPSAQTRTSVTVNHNLGFIPAFIAFASIGDNYLQLPYLDPGPAAGAGTMLTLIDVYLATSTQIVFEFINYTGNQGADIPIKYFLLKQTAN